MGCLKREVPGSRISGVLRRSDSLAQPARREGKAKTFGGQPRPIHNGNARRFKIIGSRHSQTSVRSTCKDRRAGKKDGRAGMPRASRNGDKNKGRGAAGIGIGIATNDQAKPISVFTWKQALPRLPDRPGVGLISLCAGHVKAWAVSACEGKGNGEIPQSRLLLDAMETGSLLIADRGFCSWFPLARGNDAVVRLHQRRSPDARVAKVLGSREVLQVWPRPACPDWLDEETYRSLPDALSVRVVTDRDWHIATTLLDPDTVSREEIAVLYRDRWHIELDFRSIKQTMQMDILRCRTPEMVKKEIAAHLLGYNLIRALMVHAAAAGKALPRSLSFIGAKRLLGSFHARLRHHPETDFVQEFTRLLAGIAQLRLPHRPDRVEPRAIKRRPKPQALLRQLRQPARRNLMASRVDALR